MSSSVGTASSRRATVTKFAGVAMADREPLERRALRDPRHGLAALALPLALGSRVDADVLTAGLSLRGRDRTRR